MMKTTPPTSAFAKAGPGWYERSRSLVRAEAGEIRLVDFLLFLLMITPLRDPVIGLVGYQLMPILAVIIGFCRRPVRTLGRYRWLVALNVVMLAYLGVVSMMAEQSEDAEDWRRRLFRMAVVTVMMWFIASGRIHLKSALAGFITSLAINIPAFYVGLASDAYGGYLTGFLGDKNQAGLAYAIFGLLGLLLIRSTPWQLAWIAAVSAPLWLTGSRTSLAGFAAGALWILLAHRLSVFWKALLALLIYGGISLLNSDFARVGVFADRAGSDALRGRIDEAAWVKVQETGFFGQGLGEAVVRLLDGDSEAVWFFHNAYWTAYVEGGWPWLIFLLAVMVFVGVRPFSAYDASLSMQARAVQGASVALLVCATRLGEVFYTNVWAIALGAALSVLLAERGQASAEAPGITADAAAATSSPSPGPRPLAAAEPAAEPTTAAAENPSRESTSAESAGLPWGRGGARR